MFGLEKYKEALGKPGVGTHAHGIFGFAVIDLLATLCVAYLIARFTGLNFYLCSGVLIIVAIVMHRMFGVNTRLNVLLFGTV